MNQSPSVRPYSTYREGIKFSFNTFTNINNTEILGGHIQTVAVAILMGVHWYFIMASICISLTAIFDNVSPPSLTSFKFRKQLLVLVYLKE